MSGSVRDNFNNHSKASVLNRNFERDVTGEPIIVREENGRYWVHENLTMGERLSSAWDSVASLVDGRSVERFGKIVEYASRDEMVLALRLPLEEIRTLGQYRADSEILHVTDGLGPELDGNSTDMRTRIADIEADMRKAGLTETSFVASENVSTPTPLPSR
jgi:hypothetical protein